MTSKPTFGNMLGATKTDTFLGLPACASAQDVTTPMAILGVPCATPYTSVGAYCAGGPDAIRQAISDDAGLTHHVDFDFGGPLFDSDTPQACDLGNLCWLTFIFGSEIGQRL